MANKYDGQRLDRNTIKHYLSIKYNVLEKDVKSNDCKFLSTFESLNQDDYGEAGDCAITAMTACIRYLTKCQYTITEVYNTVEKIGKKFLYRGSWGTPLPLTGIIYQTAIKKFLKKKKIKSKFIKNIKTIKEQINNNNPVVLSIINGDGRNCYMNHTITIVGYEQFIVNGQKVETLLVYDNWDHVIHYVDYALLNKVVGMFY